MSKASPLTAWLEAKALYHKKHHHDILGEQKCPGSRLFMIRTIGPHEAKYDKTDYYYEMADKDHRITVAIPGSVIKEFNKLHASPLQARGKELLSIEEFYFTVLNPPVAENATGQPAAVALRKAGPTFGMRVLKLREYAMGGTNTVRGRATLREAGGKEVREWIAELERAAQKLAQFTTEQQRERQRSSTAFYMEDDPAARLTRAPTAKGKGVDRGEGGAAPRQKSFDYSQFSAPGTLAAAIAGCQLHVQDRLKSDWKVEDTDDAEPAEPPQASTSSLLPAAAPHPRRSSPSPTTNTRRASSTRPEDLGPPNRLNRVDSLSAAAGPSNSERGPPQALPTRRPPSPSSAPRPRRPEDQGPPRRIPRLASATSAARSTTTNAHTARSSPQAQKDGINNPSPSAKPKEEKPPSPTFSDFSPSQLREVDLLERARITTTTTSPRGSSVELPWSPSPPPRQQPDEDVPTSPSPPQAGQRPTDSVQYSQFPQESISVDVSVLSVTSQVVGQPLGGRLREQQEEEEEDLPPSRQESGESQASGRRAWEVAEEEAPSSDVVVKEEEMEEEMEEEASEAEDLESDEEQEVVDLFGMMGGGRKKIRPSASFEDGTEQEGDLPFSSSASQVSDTLALPRQPASEPVVNYLASSPATHVSNSQPSMPVTQVSQEEEGASVSSGSSSGRKRGRQQLRALNGEEEEMEQEYASGSEQKKRKTASSPPPSSKHADPPQSSTLAAISLAAISLPQSQHQPEPSNPSHSPPFILTPAQLALFIAEQEAWARAIELPPMMVVEVPTVRWREQRMKA